MWQDDDGLSAGRVRRSARHRPGVRLDEEKSAGRAIKSLSNGFPTQAISSSPVASSASRLGSNAPCPLAAMHSSGFTLATVLIFGSCLFVLATLFFGTKGGYYNTDSYDGNGTAH